MQRVTRFIIRIIVNILIAVANITYRAEGINVLMLVLPAKLIGPTLRKFGASIGEAVQIHSPLIIHNAGSERNVYYQNLVIGDHCYIGRDVFFDLKQRIVLEPYVTISMRCTLITHTDVGERPPELQVLTASAAPITLKQGCYLGAGAMILQGVTVGTTAIVGAGAVVRTSVDAQARVGGVPARSITAHDVNQPTNALQ